MTAQFPALEHFFGAYLNLDWPEEYGSVPGAVNAFVADEGVERVLAVRRELGEIAACALSETEMRTVLNDLGCGYWPLPEVTFADWLRQLEGHFDEAMR